MRKRIGIFVFLCLVLSLGVALAKTEQGTGSGGGTGAASALSTTDRAFLNEAAIGGLMEVQLGQIAQQKAESSDVKDFGSRMEKDHSSANSALEKLAAQKNITLPTELDTKHKMILNTLSYDSGAAFDKAYMRDMVKDHTEDVAKFKKASKSLKDPDLKNWATTTLPTLEQHLDLAKSTAEKVGASSTKTDKSE